MSDRKPGATEELIAELKDVLAKSFAGNVEVAARVRDLVRGLAADAPAAVRDPGVRRELVARWLAFNVESFRALTDSSLATMNAIVTAAETTLLRTQPAATVPGGSTGPAAVADAVDLVVQGRRGERLSAPFLLENHYDRSLDVTFAVEPFHAVGRPDVPAALLSFEPAQIAIPAKGQTIAHAVVDLGGAFDAGVTYGTVIRLVGYDARSMRLSVRVDEPPAAAATTPRPPRRKRARST